jgi:TonB family protein
MTVTDGGQPRRIDVPVEMPEGMSREGVFGEDETAQQVELNIAQVYSRKRAKSRSEAKGVGGGIAMGDSAGMIAPAELSAINVTPRPSPTPPPKPPAQLGVMNAPAPPPPPPPPSKGVPPQMAASPKKLAVSGGVLQGKATRKVQPAYPPIAKSARAQGAVQIQVTISESGEVMNAQAISGHPMLREAALQAAKQWRFKPTEISGVPVKTQGLLTFNFVQGKTAMPGETVSMTPLPEEQFKQRLLAKLHPAVAAVIERLNNKDAKPGAEELKFTRDGKAEIQVWLTDKSAETIGQLKKLGFETLLAPQSSKLIIGRLPVEKLAALVELPAVRYIAPQTR